MRFTTKQAFVLLSWCSLVLASGCQDNGSSTGTDSAGAGTTTQEEAGAASLHLLESSASLLAQAVGDELGRFEDTAVATLAIGCPAGFPSSDLCEEGSVTLDFQTCSLNQLGSGDFFLSKLTGQFLSCARDGVQISGELSADAELKLTSDCILGSTFAPCLPLLARLNQLAGLLMITDESGKSWELKILSGFFEGDWATDGSGLFDGHLTDGELELQDGEGARFRCVIHDGITHCDPDTDRDGVFDPEDSCPTVSAGVLDEAGDGCPDVVDDTDPLCKTKPSCTSTADCDHFLNACPNIAEVMGNRELYPPLGLGVYCNRLDGVNQCELFRRIVAPFGECPSDTPPPPDDVPAGPECRPLCVTDGDCPQHEPCEGCEPNPVICYQGCCQDGGDSDHDGVINVADNCYSVPNENQANCDGDRFGDVCDTCPADFEINSSDFDRDTVGDACETGSECGNGFCELEENVVTCGEDCDPENALIVCDPAISGVSDCRERFVELGQSPLSPFDNPLAPQFIHALYNETEILNCCESIGCNDSENCGPGSYCDTAGYCALIPCSSEAECGGSSCLPDGWCDVTCGNGVCDEGETVFNCSHDCVDRPPPVPDPTCTPTDPCDADEDCAVGEFCDADCSCQVVPPKPCTPTETSCSDGTDNDCEGGTDCADSDCSSDAACSAPPPPPPLPPP